MSRPSLKPSQDAVARAVIQRLFVLELNAGRIHSMNTDGSDRKTIVSDCHLPDGIVVDSEAGHIYWTNMGIPSLNDGSVERADIDGKNRKVIVAKGVTHSPKQIILDKKGGKLYWCDREGMRVMRCNLDGAQLETLIETGRDAMVRWADDRSEIRTHLLDTKRSRQCRARPPVTRQCRNSRRPNRSDQVRHRDLLRPPAGADRYRTRPQEPGSLLDRPRRPSARQHREPGLDRQQARRAGDRGDPSHGGNRHRARRSKRPNVRDRFRRLSLLRTARWIRRTRCPRSTG